MIVDPVLVDSAAAGDPAAIARLLATVQPDIRRYARASCRNPSDVEDAVQETLIAVYRRIGGLRNAVALSAWLYRIVDRWCLRLTLRLAGVPAAQRAEEFDRHIARLSPAELRMDLARAIESLPDHYRAVIVLRDFEEFTVNEIAETLGATRETVKARLRRGRALMREYLSAAG